MPEKLSQLSQGTERNVIPEKISKENLCDVTLCCRETRWRRERPPHSWAFFFSDFLSIKGPIRALFLGGGGGGCKYFHRSVVEKSSSFTCFAFAFVWKDVLEMGPLVMSSQVWEL